MMLLLFNSAVRTLSMGLVAEAAFRMLRLHHPAFRKAVWACILFAGFVIPFQQAHSILILVPSMKGQVLSLSFPALLRTGFHATSAHLAIHADRAVQSPVISHLSKWSLLPTVVVALYLLVVAVLLLRLFIGLRSAVRLLLRSTTLQVGSTGLVRVSEEIDTPWTFGSWILLPSHANGWDEEQLQLVLAHETSHVRQLDFYLQLAARVYTALFWFSPLGWWLQKECERLGEQTSDHAALSIARSSYRYARLLLQFSTDRALPAVCMARRSGVRFRVESILAQGALIKAFDRPQRAAVIALFVGLLSIVTGNLSLKGQSTTDANEIAKPTVPFQSFDVVTVRSNNAGNDNMELSSDETTFHAKNISLKMLLMNAYGVRDGLMSGLPKWADNAHYDINAKTSEPNPAFKGRVLPRDQGEAIWRARMQAILTNRFHLKVHYEMITAPVYDLVLLPSGPKFDVSKVPDSQEGMSVHNSSLTGLHIPMKSLCASLEGPVERSVIDKTGLTGVYDIKLVWTPEDQANTASDSGTANPPPDMYTALQEQLGLKLVSAKGPVRKLVIDSIDLPSAN